MERKDNTLTCVRKKCELALKESKFNIGAASEGSFEPHPFTTSDHEILYFIDEERGFHSIKQHTQKLTFSLKTSREFKSLFSPFRILLGQYLFLQRKRAH